MKCLSIDAGWWNTETYEVIPVRVPCLHWSSHSPTTKRASFPQMGFRHLQWMFVSITRIHIERFSWCYNVCYELSVWILIFVFGQFFFEQLLCLFSCKSCILWTDRTVSTKKFTVLYLLKEVFTNAPLDHFFMISSISFSNCRRVSKTSLVWMNSFLLKSLFMR
jgi:hypothetical protein